MTSADTPTSRSDWASLNWKEAQYEVSQLLKRAGYTAVEEKIFDNHKRSDVVVFRKYSNHIIFGIIEVKCYKKISKSVETKAMQQALNYLQILYDQVIEQRRWENLEKQFFSAIVFTKDYPGIDTHHIEAYQDHITKRLTLEEPIIISTTPNSLLKRLNQYFPEYRTQTSLEDYW